MVKLFVGILFIMASLEKGTAGTFGTELCFYSGAILAAFGLDSVITYIVNKILKK